MTKAEAQADAASRNADEVLNPVGDGGVWVAVREYPGRWAVERRLPRPLRPHDQLVDRLIRLWIWPWGRD